MVKKKAKMRPNIGHVLVRQKPDLMKNKIRK